MTTAKGTPAAGAPPPVYAGRPGPDPPRGPLEHEVSSGFEDLALTRERLVRGLEAQLASGVALPVEPQTLFREPAARRLACQLYSQGFELQGVQLLARSAQCALLRQLGQAAAAQAMTASTANRLTRGLQWGKPQAFEGIADLYCAEKSGWMVLAPGRTAELKGPLLRAKWLLAKDPGCHHQGAAFLLSWYLESSERAGPKAHALAQALSSQLQHSIKQQRIFRQAGTWVTPNGLATTLACALDEAVTKARARRFPAGPSRLNLQVCCADLLVRMELAQWQGALWRGLQG